MEHKFILEEGGSPRAIVVAWKGEERERRRIAVEALREKETELGAWYMIAEGSKERGGMRYELALAKVQPTHRVLVTTNPLDEDPVTTIYGVCLVTAQGPFCKVRTKGDVATRSAGLLWSPSIGWSIEGTSVPWALQFLALHAAERTQRSGPRG